MFLASMCHWSFPIVAGLTLLSQSALAANRTWNNTGTDFNTAGNWTGGVPGTGDVALFNAAKTTNPNLSASLTIQSVNFSTTVSSGYDLTSSSTSIKLTLTNTGTGTGSAIHSVNNSGTNTMDAPIVLGAASGTQTFHQDNGGTLVVNGVISSPNGIALGLRSTGGGTIQLNGANTYTAGTTVNSNNITLVLGNDSALGTGSLDMSGTSTIQAGGGSRTINNAITLSAVTTVSGSNDLTLSGIVSGTFALIKSGSGTLTLSGANTYDDLTTVSVGVLNIRNATALGATTTGTTVSSGAALQIQGGIAVGAEALTLGGGGISSDGALRNISGNNSWSGNITLGSATTIASDSGTLTLSGTLTNGGFGVTYAGSGNVTENGIISGTGGLTKNGSGTLTLGGINLYTGNNTINGGTIAVSAVSSLGAVTTTLTINAGTLEVATGHSTSRTISVSDSASTFQVDPSQTFTVTSAIGGTGALNKTGSGTMVLGGANTYSGGTNVNAGTLQISASERLANSGALTVGGGTFDVQTFSETVAGVTLSSGSIAGSGAGTLTGSGYTMQSGTASAILAGSGNLTKSTGGTVTLSGANTFTGTTTVSGGTLILSAGSGSALGSTSGITVNSGGILQLGASDQINNSASVTLAGGKFVKGNFSEGTTSAQGMGALTLTAAGSIIDFGTGTVGILSFSSLNTGAFSLTINNWTGTANTLGSGSTDRLIFDSDQLLNLPNFSFTSFTGAIEFALGGGYFEVAPLTFIPEPKTYAVGLLAFVVLAFDQGRRLRKRRLARLHRDKP